MARIAALHVFGAAAGGAVVGGLLGWLGSLLALPPWRAWIIGAVALWAFGNGVIGRPIKLGRQSQVPRNWPRTMPAGLRYVLWGAMLGSGIATPIVYSASLVLLGSQLTTGALLGAASGAVFGGTREAIALLPLLRRLDHRQTMVLLPNLGPLVQRLNTVVVLGGGLLLALVSRR